MSHIILFIISLNSKLLTARKRVNLYYICLLRTNKINLTITHPITRKLMRNLPHSLSRPLHYTPISKSVLGLMSTKNLLLDFWLTESVELLPLSTVHPPPPPPHPTIVGSHVNYLSDISLPTWREGGRRKDVN